MMILELVILILFSVLILIPFVEGFIFSLKKISPVSTVNEQPDPAQASASQPDPEPETEPINTVNIHIGDRIGTQVKDSFVQRSDIGGDKEAIARDAIEALVSLGYKKRYSQETIYELIQNGNIGNAEELIKEALKRKASP